MRNRRMGRRAQQAEDAGRIDVPPGRPTARKGKGSDWDVGKDGRTAAKGNICFTFSLFLRNPLLVEIIEEVPFV